MRQGGSRRWGGLDPGAEPGLLQGVGPGRHLVHGLKVVVVYSSEWGHCVDVACGAAAGGVGRAWQGFGPSRFQGVRGSV